MKDQIPTQGGSYVRKPDGSLERVEFTAPAPMVADRSAPTSEPRPEEAAGAKSRKAVKEN